MSTVFNKDLLKRGSKVKFNLWCTHLSIHVDLGSSWKWGEKLQVSNFTINGVNFHFYLIFYLSEKLEHVVIGIIKKKQVCIFYRWVLAELMLFFIEYHQYSGMNWEFFVHKCKDHIFNVASSNFKRIDKNFNSIKG